MAAACKFGLQQKLENTLSGVLTVYARQLPFFPYLIGQFAKHLPALGKCPLTFGWYAKDRRESPHKGMHEESRERMSAAAVGEPIERAREGMLRLGGVQRFEVVREPSESDGIKPTSLLYVSGSGV